MQLNKFLDVKPEVAEAIAAGKPVVALESTIISHGMPYPQNVRDRSGGRAASSARTAPCPRPSPSSAAA